MFRKVIFPLILLTQITFAQTKTNLFNGKNLEGWYRYQTDTGKQSEASKLFKVEKGMIRFNGAIPGYLMTTETFNNFKLTVKYRWNTDVLINQKSGKKNSGVMYLVPTQTPDVLWPKGIQYQIKEGATGDFVFLQDVTLLINGIKTEPGRSVVYKHFKDAEKPFGKWNKIDITVLHGKITQELNGQLVNEGSESSVSEGKILLQYEGYPIDFCKVIIKKLKP